MIIIYHASCHDGFCCAWLLHHIYPDAEFMPYQYGMEPPNVSGHDVIVADFSFSVETMLQMAKDAKSILCFDHHKSVDTILKHQSWFYFDNEKSGARLVYEHFTHDLAGVRNAAWLVDYTEDRDLWRFELEESWNVNAGLRLVDFDFETWSNLSLADVIDDGVVLCEYFEKKSKRMAKNHSWLLIGDYIAPCVNCANSDLISMIGQELANVKHAPFGMTYFHDGEQFVFSLRSINGYDVSSIAKDFGGGGHTAAAGFKRKQFFQVVEGPNA